MLMAVFASLFGIFKMYFFFAKFLDPFIVAVYLGPFDTKQLYLFQYAVIVYLFFSTFSC